MNVVELTVPVVMRISGDPALYAAAPFLLPMRDATLSLHQKYRVNCTSCVKAAKYKAFGSVANAMTSLLIAEANQTGPNKLKEFKAVTGKILNAPVDEILIRYKKDGKDAELRF